MSSDPVETIVSFLGDIEYATVPPDLVDFVEQRFVDTVGVMVAGRTKEPASILQELAAGRDAGPIETPFDVAEHGFVLGTTGHCLDYDDSTHSTHAHLSVTLIPTILALAASRRLRGTDAIVGYLAGFESAYYLARQIMDAHYKQGWHGTGTVGTFAATATAATLLDLDRDETRHALNMAASMPSGLRANFGSMTKPIHAGLAVRSGLTAAQLAEHGVTSNPAAITGTFGFYDVYARSRESTNDDESFTLGEDWGSREEGANAKMYPCCHEAHAGIVCASNLVATNDVDPAAIQAIDITTTDLVTENLVHANPATPAEAKFSMHYLIANAILHGTVTHQMFTTDVIGDPAVQALRERVTMTADPALPYGYETTVQLTLTDGTTHSATAVHPPGVETPVTDEMIAEKFDECTDALADDEAPQLYESLAGLRDLEDVSTLVPYCYPR